MNTIKQAVATAVMLAATTVANAGFVTVDSNASSSTVTVAGNNDFRSAINALGVNSYALGASLGTDVAGSVTYYYYGKEAGYRNDMFSADLHYASGFTPQKQNYFGAPVQIGTTQVGAGLLDFRFCAYSSGMVSQGCVTNAQNDALSLGSWQSIAMSIVGDSAWLFWDDSGAGPDDDHDDMIIRAIFTPRAQVPEAGTLALFGLGLLGFGAARRAGRKSS